MLTPKDYEVVGKITSAVYSPRLKQNIALAMVTINNSEIRTVLGVKRKQVGVI